MRSALLVCKSIALLPPLRARTGMKNAKTNVEQFEYDVLQPLALNHFLSADATTPNVLDETEPAPTTAQ